MSGLGPLLGILHTLEGERDERIPPRLVMLAICLDPIQRISTYIGQLIQKEQLTNATGAHARTLTSPP